MTYTAELKQIIKLATKRRATQLARLSRYQASGDALKCDQIYARISYENEILHNAGRELVRIQREAA